MKHLALLLCIFMLFWLSCENEPMTPDPVIPVYEGTPGPGIWVLFTGETNNQIESAAYKYSFTGSVMVQYPCFAPWEIIANHSSGDVWINSLTSSQEPVCRIKRLSDTGLLKAEYLYTLGNQHDLVAVNDDNGDVWITKRNEIASQSYDCVMRLDLNCNIQAESEPNAFPPPFFSADCYYANNYLWYCAGDKLHLLDANLDIILTVRGMDYPHVSVDQRDGSVWISGELMSGTDFRHYLRKYSLNGETLIHWVCWLNLDDVKVEQNSGSLYAVDSQKIYKYTADGSLIWAVTANGDKRSIDCSSDGSLWVLYIDGKKVQHYSSDGLFLEELIFPSEMYDIAVRD